jgi:hypothetical protein
MNQNRAGKFSIPASWFDNLNYNSLAPLFDKVIITRAEYIYHYDRIEYTALSDSFDELHIGDDTPWYTATITTTPHGTMTEWKRS